MSLVDLFVCFSVYYWLINWLSWLGSQLSEAILLVMSLEWIYLFVFLFIYSLVQTSSRRGLVWPTQWSSTVYTMSPSTCVRSVKRWIIWSVSELPQPCRKLSNTLYWPVRSSSVSATELSIHALFLCASAGTAIARLSHRNSVRPSVCHTGGSGKNSAS